MSVLTVLLQFIIVSILIKEPSLYMVLSIVGKFIYLYVYCDPDVILFHIRDVWQRSNRHVQDKIWKHSPPFVFMLSQPLLISIFFCLAISLRYHLFVHIIIPCPAFSSLYFSFLSSFFMASWLSAVFHTLCGQVIPNKWLALFSLHAVFCLLFIIALL